MRRRRSLGPAIARCVLQGTRWRRTLQERCRSEPSSASARETEWIAEGSVLATLRILRRSLTWPNSLLLLFPHLSPFFTRFQSNSPLLLPFPFPSPASTPLSHIVTSLPRQICIPIIPLDHGYEEMKMVLDLWYRMAVLRK